MRIKQRLEFGGVDSRWSDPSWGDWDGSLPEEFWNRLEAATANLGMDRAIPYRGPHGPFAAVLPEDAARFFIAGGWDVPIGFHELVSFAPNRIAPLDDVEWAKAMNRKLGFKVVEPGHAEREIQLGVTREEGDCWRLVQMARGDDLRIALHTFLRAADKALAPPTAHEVLSAWHQNRPPGILKVTTDSVDFLGNGGAKVTSADIQAISERIARLVERVPASKAQ